jgi:hypothetical protein
MALVKALGKKELKELGCNFVVANVPIFAAVSDPKKVNRMTTEYFATPQEAAAFVEARKPVVVFDLTGVYKDKADKQDPKLKSDVYALRCCVLTNREFESIRANLKETETLNFTYKFDFECWFNHNK